MFNPWRWWFYINIHALLPFPVNGAVFGGANRYLATKDFQTMLIKTQKKPTKIRKYKDLWRYESS